jgi:hypothetical protein
LIPLNTPVVLDFVGDGTEQIEFPVSFPTFEESNVEAEIITPTGAIVPLVNETHYVLDNIGIPNTDAIFILTVSPSFEWTDTYGLKDEFTLKIKFSTNAFQPVKLRDLGRFAPEMLEKIVDRLTMNTLAVRQIALETPEKLEELTNTVAGISEQVIAQQEEIDALDTQLLSVLNRLDTAEGSISDLTDENTSQQSTIDGLVLEAGVAATTLADHESRIQLLESVEPIFAQVELKNGNFTAEFGKVYVVADTLQSVAGDGTLGSVEIDFAFDSPDDLEVRVVSPTSEVTVLTRNTGGPFDPINGEYAIDGQILSLYGGPYPWIGDGGFGGLEVGWTLVIELKQLLVSLPSPVANRILEIKKLGSGLVTLVRSAAEKIDNISDNKNLTSTKESVTLISDGVDWFII